MINGLEVVPRKRVDYRGSRLPEMDVDAVIVGHPEVALIDELAHANVPGSGRNAKRWQDVMDIRAAGINVITTVNIQHLESIANEVEHMTGAKVRERVPDWVVRKADQIELIDSSPEQLRRRMVHGNIYPKERVQRALNSFFRIDNLTALRELALRFLADETDEDLLEHLRRHESTAVWETCERVMVAVTSAPGPMACCGGRPGWPPGSRENSTSSTSPPATPPGPERQVREEAGGADRRRRRPLVRGTRRRSRPGHRPLRARAPDHPDRDRVQPAQPVAATAPRRLERQPGPSGGRPGGIDVHVIALHKAPREGPTEETADVA